MPQPALLLCLPELQPRPRPEPAEELGVDLCRTQQDHAAHLPLGLSSSSVGPRSLLEEAVGHDLPRGSKTTWSNISRELWGAQRHLRRPLPYPDVRSQGCPCHRPAFRKQHSVTQGIGWGPRAPSAPSHIPNREVR